MTFILIVIVCVVVVIVLRKAFKAQDAEEKNTQPTWPEENNIGRQDSEPTRRVENPVAPAIAIPVAAVIPSNVQSNVADSSKSSKFQGFRTYNVGGYTYLMSYFEAIFSSEGTPMGVADQFTSFVARYAASGFEFFRCDEVPNKVVPGCLSGLFGAKTSFGNCTIVTFRKKMD